MVAISLVVLLIPVAFVIDIGSARLERRQAQTAADAAALAAVRVLSDGGTRADAAETAIRLTYENTKGQNGAASLADWRARWTSCADPGRPGAYVATAAAPVATECISFTASDSQVRVKVPTLDVGTHFAGVIGVRSLSTSALAEARITMGGSGGYAVFGKSTSCNSDATVVLKGGTNIIDGPVHSNNTVIVDGGSHVTDGVSHTGSFNNQAGPGNVPNLGNVPALPDPLAAAAMSQYRPGGALREAAVAAGVPFFDVGNATVTNAFILSHGDGIYYTTRNVMLTTASSLAGRHVTFVVDNPSASGETFDTNGTGYDLRYYASDAANPHKFLIFTNGHHGCATGDHATIHFNGSSGHWEGVLYAPDGSIHLNGSGSGVELLGAAIAGTVLLDGTGHRLQNPGDFLSLPPSAALIR
jgi:Flp pilus assembly protein TadG